MYQKMFTKNATKAAVRLQKCEKLDMDANNFNHDYPFKTY